MRDAASCRGPDEKKWIGFSSLKGQGVFPCVLSRRCATCLSVLVLVESQGVGAVLVVIDAVLSLLAELEELADGPLHHHLLAAARADTGDITLCVHY